MKAYRFKSLLTSAGWLEDCVVAVGEEGRIVSVGRDDGADAENVSGFALPGFQNAHSHAFQYAMAGLAERHEGSGVPDDFWSWRTAMYELALTVSPDHLQAIATMLYAEMLRHGYTAVAEFHYLHNDPDGSRYGNPAEMGLRLVAAAEEAGIGITLVPMLYQMGGFGTPASENQRRFVSKSLDDYGRLLELSAAAVSEYERASIGSGIHSLRAVDENAIRELTSHRDSSRPFHLHISEQLKEVEDCMAFYGKRPVEWLLDHVDVDEHFHLVHATHLSDAEVRGIALSGANVVLCPTTEGNLGDGLFRFADFQAAGGCWSIGTDSHVGLDPLEELRLLDYGQRLTTHKRDTFHLRDRPDSGFNALSMAWNTGQKAIGLPAGNFFMIGQPLDAVIYDAANPLLAVTGPSHRCNTIVYSCSATDVLGTMVSGKWMVREGRHFKTDSITARFKDTLNDLGSRL